MNSWKLRDEILTVSQRWYQIVMFILFGALIGWGGGLIWPSNYRATVDLDVALNAYRHPFDDYIASFAEQEFRNVDDYKHWQMEQLNSLVLSDEFLEDTLSQLQSQYRTWNGISTAEFRTMLDVSWRNVGVWHLTVEGSDSSRTAEALRVWQDVIVEKISEAVDHSGQVVSLDAQMMALANEIAIVNLRISTLETIQTQIDAWLGNLENMPAALPVSGLDHWKIFGIVARAADWNYGWVAILEQGPDLESPPDAYLDWLVGVTPLIDSELILLPDQLTSLEQTMHDIELEYLIETERSKALSSNLVVEKQTNEIVVQQIQPNLILLGAFLGLSIWIILAFYSISMQD